MSQIYTIGHGARKADQFLELLKRYDIHFLVDVRSVPFSRFHPQFNQKTLNIFLALNGIHYMYMGDLLGGRPNDPTCYDENGRINYSILSTKPYYQQGIGRLLNAANENLKVAIMCSERDPAFCHRSKLIGESLTSELVNVYHIDQHGLLQPHERLINSVLGSNNLFSNN